MIEGGENVVDVAYIQAGRWEIEIAGKTYPAEVSLKPMYDPEMKRIKC
jgi:4-methylaminobutanoate oxidase (formaldehyde-forming)